MKIDPVDGNMEINPEWFIEIPWKSYFHVSFRDVFLKGTVTSEWKLRIYILKETALRKITK